MYQYSCYRGSKWKRKKGVENIFKDIIAGNLLNLEKEIDIQVQKARSPKEISQRGLAIPRHTVINTTNTFLVKLTGWCC